MVLILSQYRANPAEANGLPITLLWPRVWTVPATLRLYSPILIRDVVLCHYWRNIELNLLNVGVTEIRHTDCYSKTLFPVSTRKFQDRSIERYIRTAADYVTANVLMFCDQSKVIWIHRKFLLKRAYFGSWILTISQDHKITHPSKSIFRGFK